MDFDREKVVASFLAESQEGLERSEQYLIAADTEPGNPDLLEEVFRVTHTIKGNASAWISGAGGLCPCHGRRTRSAAVAISRDDRATARVDALRALLPRLPMKRPAEPSHETEAANGEYASTSYWTTADALRNF
jgi:hypothetical protein